jgi:hypothetical protein
MIRIFMNVEVGFPCNSESAPHLGKGKRPKAFYPATPPTPSNLNKIALQASEAHPEIRLAAGKFE